MKRFHKSFLIALALAYIFVSSAQAIIIRHDRDDSKYVALGARYPAVCFIGRDGEGTLIAPRWVLTAAHVVDHLPKDARRVRFDTVDYPIEKVILHPDWKPGEPEDVALLMLSRPVEAVSPVALYTDTDEAGKLVTFVGRGDTGTGLTGPKIMDKKKRAATNKVDSADNEWLYFTFDDPATATELEGISGPGDSGGPALIEKDGRLYTAGISVWGRPGKNGRGTYGAREGYTRVSSYTDWITSVMSNTVQPALQSQANSVDRSQSGSQRPIDDPAVRKATDYIRAFNSGDTEVMRRFLTENFFPGRSIDDRLQTYRQIYNNLGALEVQRIIKSGDGSITLFVRASKEGPVQLQFEIESQPPHRIKSLGVEVGDTDDEEPAVKVAVKPPANEMDIGRAADEYFNKLVEADLFSGAVLIAKDGKPIYQKAFGLASKEHNTPNRADTKFNLGSINKFFTDTAIVQLAEQGKLSLDDTIIKHLPDYPNHQAAEKITIRHLLTHSSGIGDFFGEKYVATPKNRIRKISDYFQFFAAQPLLFEPGTSRRYSNGGYVVLGAIIEKVSGKSYYDYVRENIFVSAGMSNTDSYETDVPTPNLASGYTRRGEGREADTKERRNNIYTRPARGSSAGGGYSTTDDMLRFTIALQNAKLLSPEFTLWLLNRMPGNPPSKSLPSSINTPIKDGDMGIAGGAPGINAALEFDFASGYTVIVLSNYDPPAAERPARQIRGWIGGISR